MVKTYDDISTKCSERHPVVLSQTTLGIDTCILRCKLLARKATSLHIANKLTWRWHILHHLAKDARRSCRAYATMQALLDNLDSEGMAYLNRLIYICRSLNLKCMLAYLRRVKEEVRSITI